ncbi:phosphoserine phosphatase SerB, partial [bacterium]|nr:phosphoserine phosphatase SerB [bacterium]
PYHVFFSPGDPHRLAFDLMGGGACWDALTCYGLPDTWTHPIPFVLEQTGFVSEHPYDSPVAGASLVFFPYCTADIHLGRHDAQYGPFKVHHQGGRNFNLALDYLGQQKVLKWQDLKQFVLMGYSAGALGSLVHSLMLDRLMPPSTDRVLIADSPGLHFGPNYWKKFSEKQIHDFNDALSPVGVNLATGNGNLSEAVVRLCRLLPHWRIGVLQASRDIVMSSVFGNITPSGQEALLYGDEGLYRRTKRLVVFDMDSTLIQNEVIDEFARELDVYSEISAITHTAMKGGMDFDESLRVRVDKLKGLTTDQIDRVFQRIELTPGAADLIRVLKKLGYKTALISGGFSCIADRFKEMLGIDYAYANCLEIAGGRATGRVLPPI